MKNISRLSLILSRLRITLNCVTPRHIKLSVEEAVAESLNRELVDELLTNGSIQSASVEDAFRKVFRHHFLPGHNWGEVYSNRAVAVRFHPRHGASICSSSEPTVMATMLEWLQVEPGMKVLEVGTGTGYNAALLAELTGAPERVWTMDVDEEICTDARKGLEAAGYTGVNVIRGDGWHGHPDAAPYDRIIVTAHSYDLAPAWFEQLRDGSILLVPWGGPTHQYQRTLALKKGDGKLTLLNKAGFGFMAMRGAFEGEVTDDTGARWLSGWMDEGQVKRLCSLLTGEPWKKPCSLLSDPDSFCREDLLFFLSVMYPRVVMRFTKREDGMLEGKTGWAEVDESKAGFVEVWNELVGWGDEAPAEKLLELIPLWFDLGQPKPDGLQFDAYPLEEREFSDNALWVRRRWFDYRIFSSH